MREFQFRYSRFRYFRYWYFQIRMRLKQESPGTVDLGIEVTSLGNTGSAYEQKVRIFNQHERNVATSPVVKIQLLEQEVVVSIDSCIVNDQTLYCDLPEIGPGQDYTFETTIIAVNSSISLFVDVESQQPDRNLDNNNARFSRFFVTAITAPVTVFYIDEFGNKLQEPPTPIQTGIPSEPVVIDTAEVEDNSQEPVSYTHLTLPTTPYV